MNDKPLRIPSARRRGDLQAHRPVLRRAPGRGTRRTVNRKPVAKLARKRPLQLARGDLRIWAGAVIYTVGSINFLFDRTQRPHLTGEQLASLTGIPKSTLTNKAKLIRDLLDVGPFDREFSRRQTAQVLDDHGQ
jgi:hypothetical protein